MGAANTVEQRWSQRRSVALGVDIYRNEALLNKCQSRDVGLGGVFLDLEQGSLQQHQDVELFFTLGENSETRHKLKARVVRVSDDGVGLMFRDFDTGSFRALQEIMRYSLSANPA